MLQDIDDKGGKRDVPVLDYWDDFNRQWQRYEPEERQAIIDTIDAKLDQLAATPDTRWGAILNTSIEGGQVNPFNGRPGDWEGTVWSPIYEHSGQSEQQAALFFGLIWKWRVIEHRLLWIGIRTDPTFPQRGVTLQGKTYFLDRSSR